MISLADLRTRNVAPTWQEAVAVVQELLQATAGSTNRLPDLEHVALIANGDVVALPGSQPVTEPVRHAGAILGALLDGTPMPGELTALIQRTTATPPQFANPEEFSKALAFFERPGRRGDVERLVSRAMAAEAQSRADEELRRLKERATAAADQTPLDEMLAAARNRRRSLLPIAIGAALVVLAVVAGVWFQVDRSRSREAGRAAGVIATTPAAGQAPGQIPTGQPQAQAQSQTEAQPSFVARVGDAIHSAVSRVFGGRDAPDAPPAAAASSPPASSAAPAPGSAAATAAAATVGEVVPERPKARPRPRAAAPRPGPPAAASPADVARLNSTPLTGPPEPASVASVTGEPIVVYTSSDPSVLPPILVRPMLPSEPPRSVPPDQVGTLELVIDELGNVEQVKLTSPANRYQERMLVASAKNWKFRPAMRDGQPVKYRTRMRVTI